MFGIDTMWPDRPTLLQFYYGLNPLLTLVGSGMVIGYSAVELPLLTEGMNDSALLKEDSNAATWFASIIGIAMPFGCIISVFTMKTGRRIAMMSSGIIVVLGWVIISTSYSIPQLLIGRFISGLGYGLASSPATVYLSEIAMMKNKTTLTACTNIASCGGVMLIYFFGFIIPNSWRLVAAASVILPIVSTTFIFFFTPESPRWLLHNGKLTEAKETLLRLRGLNSETPQFTEEFYQMSIYHEPSKQNQYVNTIDNNLVNLSEQMIDISFSSPCRSKKFSNFLSIVKLPEVWKPFVILNAYFLFQQFCGIYVIIAYAVDIVTRSGIIVDAYLITVMIGLLQFIGGVALVLCSSRMGRRSLSIISGVGMSVSLGILGAYIQLNKQAQLNQNYSAIPVVAILFFVCAGSFGFQSLPWAMLGELYPTKFINFMGPITCCLAGIFNFASLQIYPLLMSYEFSSVAYSYCSICIIATVFIIIVLPETHNHSKSEIEDFFKKN